MADIYIPEMAGRKESIAILAQQLMLSMVQGACGKDLGPASGVAYDAFALAKAYYERRDKEERP